MKNVSSEWNQGGADSSAAANSPSPVMVPVSLALLLLGSLWFAWFLLFGSGMLPEFTEDDLWIADDTRWSGGQDIEWLPRPAETSSAEHARLTVQPPGTIPDERILAFVDREELQSAVEVLRRAGVTILGSIEALNAIRIRVDPHWEKIAADWRSNEQYNIWLRMPVQPELPPEMVGGFEPFRDGWLAALGDPGLPADTRGTGVKIAVLDTGFASHSAVDSERVLWLDLIDGLTEWVDPVGHGTAVTGLILSQSDFAPGLVPGSEVLAIRVLDADGVGNGFTVAEGIVAAVDGGADVINLSLGAMQHSPLLRSAIDYALRHDVLIVAAAGNEGIGKITFPAAYPDVIGVTAIDAGRNRARFANYGEGLDFAAPGVGLYGISTDEGFIQFDGTSASAPIVAGSLALMLANDPGLTPLDAAGLLRETADDMGPPGHDALTGHGVLNLARAFRWGGNTYFDLAVADVFPDTRFITGGTLPIAISVENRGNVPASGARLEVTLSGQGYTFHFGYLEPNSVVYAELSAPMAVPQSDDGLVVQARVHPVDREQDDNPGNDSIGIRFRKVEDH